ncbi:hypothetical protein BC940DRAFT_324280 [Gongronella butleri]|nr:hypothetical protein BC940DRAFT_324280 [Gongronella butleri]
MSTTTVSRSEPVPIPPVNSQSYSYREMVKQLTAQAPQPYGAIPPMKRKKKKRSRQAVRRMSHVENWVAVDSKESLPDEEELEHSPMDNFLSFDFLTGILPLHMPPPSLSDPMFQQQLQQPPPAPTEKTFSMDDEDEEEDDDDDDDENDEEDDFDDFSPPALTADDEASKRLTGRRSIPSFTKSHTPSISTTTSYAMSSSPPDSRTKWMDTLSKLRALSTSTSPSSSGATSPMQRPSPSTSSSSFNPIQRKPVFTRKDKGFIPMPPPPRRKRSSRKRRSEATTQPRFDPTTNTYTRDTRANSDHLRMIAAELNMMRARKLFSPLKPRGFLPRRKDPFVCGEARPRSPLCSSE